MQLLPVLSLKMQWIPKNAEENSHWYCRPEVETDHIVLDTATRKIRFFSFVGTEGMFDGINVGDKVTVIYDGTLTEKMIPAQGVEK